MIREKPTKSSLSVTSIAKVGLGDPHGARATLVLAPEDTLSFELLIPHALGRDLDKVIALRLERELPLARDQFGVDYHVREHLSGTGKIRVQVLVAHRSHLDQLRELAQRWNLRATRIAALSDAGAFVGDFLRNPFRFRMMRLTLLERRLSALVLVLACMLGALTAGQWVYERIVVGAQLRRVDAQAQVASHLTEQLNRESAPARDLLRIMRVPDASDVLAALTRTVPPYAWVYQLTVDAPTSGGASIRMGAFAPPPPRPWFVFLNRRIASARCSSSPRHLWAVRPASIASSSPHRTRPRVRVIPDHTVRAV